MAPMSSTELLFLQRHRDASRLFGLAEPETLAVVQAAEKLGKVLKDCDFVGGVALCVSVAAKAGGDLPTGDEFLEVANFNKAVLRKTAQGVCLMLFLLGRAVQYSDCIAALGVDCTAVLETAGLLTRVKYADARVALLSPVQIYPFSVSSSSVKLFFATDYDVESSSADLQRLRVMPIGIDSLTLACALPHDGSLVHRRVLDVCCGSGIQGLAAAGCGATSVLCTDVSPRAVRFTSFNIVLNGLSNTVKAAVGDCRQMVSAYARCFDVILANPPFVAVPDELASCGQYSPALYVSGGRDGSDVVRGLVADLAASVGSPDAIDASTMPEVVDSGEMLDAPCVRTTMPNTGASPPASPPEAARPQVRRRGCCLLIVAQLPNIDDAHEWLAYAAQSACSGKSVTAGCLELLTVYDQRHTITAAQYAAGRALDARCSRQAWARAMKAAGVSTMGFGVVVARAREQCEAPAPFPATSIGRGKTLQAAQSWLLAAESECQSPRSEDESSGVCKQSGRVLIDFPGGSAATATMLHGAGLIQLQQAVGWGVVGQVPVPQFGGSQVETLVGSGAFGVRQPQQQRRGQGETTDASRPREARLGDGLA